LFKEQKMHKYTPSAHLHRGATEFTQDLQNSRNEVATMSHINSVI